MASRTDTFDQWLLITGQKPRFFPIPDEIAEPFDGQIARFDSRIEQIRKMYGSTKRIDIYADFIDDGRCNAVAGVWNYLGLVGINKGLILQLNEQFCRMLSHPLVLTGIGTSKDERISPQHREDLPEDHDELLANRRKRGRKLLPIGPNCPLRQKVAAACFHLACNFVIIHEVVHILHGHVDYLFGSKAAPFMLEASCPQPAQFVSEAVLDYQAIELWADSIAFCVVLNGFLDHTPMTGFDARLKLAIWTFAMYSLFRLWGLDFNPDDIASADHPPSILRLHTAITGSWLNVTGLNPEIGKDYLAVVTAALSEAENGFVRTGIRPIQRQELAKIKYPTVRAHREMLIDHFDNVLLNKLKKHSYIELKDSSEPLLPQPQTPP